MQNIKDFKIEQVPHSRIVFAATEENDYDGDRILIAESWPEWNDYTVISGNHCSCFGFDEVDWDATVYDEHDLRKVLESWVERGYGSEAVIAPLMLAYLGKD